jgi:multidrug efflux pump subunit AcrB
MSGVDNMDYMYSINANNGQSTLYVNFALGTDANTDQLLAQMREGPGRVATALGRAQLRRDGRRNRRLRR